MIVEKTISLRRMWPFVRKRMYLMALLATCIVAPIELLGLEEESTIGIQTPLILGTAMAIFLGFRTNSAYERWMGARRSFGGIGEQVRNTALLLRDPTAGTSQPVRERLIRRALAIMHIYGRELTDRPDPVEFDTVRDLLGEDEIKRIKAGPAPAMALLYKQGEDFKILARAGDVREAVELEFTVMLRSLSAHMIQAATVKNTPFPTHYTYFTNVFTWLLVALLSLSLPGNEKLGFAVVPLVVLIGWIFTMVEGIGTYMDDPWAYNRNVVPVEFLSREFEREIRRLALGEEHGLARIEPVEGALY